MRRASRPAFVAHWSRQVKRISNQRAGSDRRLRTAARSDDPEPDRRAACSAREASADRSPPSAAPCPARGRGGGPTRPARSPRAGQAASREPPSIEPRRSGPLPSTGRHEPGSEKRSPTDALVVDRRPRPGPDHAELPSALEVRISDGGPERRVLISVVQVWTRELLGPRTGANNEQRRRRDAPPAAARPLPHVKSSRRHRHPLYSPGASNLHPRAERLHARGNLGNEGVFRRAHQHFKGGVTLDVLSQEPQGSARRFGGHRRGGHRAGRGQRAVSVTVTGDDGNPIALGGTLNIRNMNPQLASRPRRERPVYSLTVTGPNGVAVAVPASCFEAHCHPARKSVDYIGNGVYTVTLTNYTANGCAASRARRRSVHDHGVHGHHVAADRAADAQARLVRDQHGPAADRPQPRRAGDRCLRRRSTWPRTRTGRCRARPRRCSPIRRRGRSACRSTRAPAPT